MFEWTHMPTVQHCPRPPLSVLRVLLCHVLFHPRSTLCYIPDGFWKCSASICVCVCICLSVGPRNEAYCYSIQWPNAKGSSVQHYSLLSRSLYLVSLQWLWSVLSLSTLSRLAKDHDGGWEKVGGLLGCRNVTCIWAVAGCFVDIATGQRFQDVDSTYSGECMDHVQNLSANHLCDSVVFWFFLEYLT